MVRITPMLFIASSILNGYGAHHSVPYTAWIARVGGAWCDVQPQLQNNVFNILEDLSNDYDIYLYNQDIAFDSALPCRLV